MHPKHKKHLLSIAALGSLTTLLLVSRSSTAALNPYEAPYTTIQRSTHSESPYIRETGPAIHADTFSYRIAERLQHRLRRRGNHIAPPVDQLEQAVRQRQDLLTHHTDITFDSGDPKTKDQWSVSFQRYPLWLGGVFTSTSAAFLIREDAIARAIADENIIHAKLPVDAVLKEVQWSTDEKRISRVVIDGIAKSGYVLNQDSAATKIADALASGTESLSVSLDTVPGKLINASGEELGSLSLLSTGRSDFKGSDNSRIANVKKALDEHVNNTITGPGQRYSFNSTLGGPVSQGNGWHMAKVIFNGGDLEYAPGGGICQTSSTVYRAALMAGLPVLERKAHSLYVSYYKKYGVGIDATIYPGSQDLVFVNDTQNPLIIQAYHEGTEAFVNVYGTPDGRIAELSGPYFFSTAPEDVVAQVKGIASNEIVWLHRVQYANGTVRSEEVSSRYKELPKSLVTEYPAAETTLHASAAEGVTD
ncbi:VanW family protein [Candidatus Peregrinibacteria bacterium]|nr:VanW family protein [Candidatus Peregrinibacteria bacterium]